MMKVVFVGGACVGWGLCVELVWSLCGVGFMCGWAGLVWVELVWAELKRGGAKKGVESKKFLSIYLCLL